MTKKDLCKLKRNKEYQRLGKLFHTSQFAYFYDTGTGKVVRLDQNSERIIRTLFDEGKNGNDFLSVLDEFDPNNEIVTFFDKEHLLSNPPVLGFTQVDASFFENLGCEQIIIELTGNCNLRCKYCIYNDFYEGNRNFNTSNIDFETARKAIDFAHAHRDPQHFAVTFYGGEPLLNFPVMKQCINYCLENFSNENLSFSFTTNLTLMSAEIAEYVAQVPNMSILASMDGPEEIHNMARVHYNGSGSFQDAFRGLKLLSAAINKYGKAKLAFNAVLMPPYTAERFDKINSFFESLSFLPEQTKVRASYPTEGTVSESYIKELHRLGLTVEEEITWTQWSRQKADVNTSSASKRNLYSDILIDSLARIHNRALYEQPFQHFYRNGCCFPGKRRLYVCTDGSYRVCERVGNAPTIGNVDSGIDVEAILAKYIEEYDEKSLIDCANCWAVNLCDVCYASCYDENGINIEMKKLACMHAREGFATWLKYYHELLETTPEKIEEIASIKLS